MTKKTFPPELGAKFDAGKADYTLLPLRDLEGVVRVLEFGANKYQRDSWQHVPDAERRYQAAAMRHIAAALDGEEFDQESNLPHLDHALCSLMFAAALRAKTKRKEALQKEQVVAITTAMKTAVENANAHSRRDRKAVGNRRTKAVSPAPRQRRTR